LPGLLNRADARGFADTVAPAPMSAATGKRPLRVLVLDDDEDMREVLTLLLCPDEGFVAEACADVASCMERLRAAVAPGGEGPFDVLLMDVLLLNGHSGMDLIEAARAVPRLRLPPLVICSALSERYLSEHQPTLLACGARVITKPFDVDTLMVELRAAAGRA
jgi:DNA-binding response OmpR family regulator